jgi:hypothetical protein
MRRIDMKTEKCVICGGEAFKTGEYPCMCPTCVDKIIQELYAKHQKEVNLERQTDKKRLETS